MKCFFGGSGMKKEYLLEEKAMLQRMLLQEQREKLSLQQDLQNERMKCAMLEQEIAQVVDAAQEMGESMTQYFSKGPEADVRTSQDQSTSSRPAQAHEHGAPSNLFAPMAMQLQCIPEHMQKQHELLEFAEQVKGFAAQLQERLARASAANTPTAAEAAAAASAGPFSMHQAPQPQPSGTPVKVPSRTHSLSVPSDQPGSMDLPMQALAVSRLALQLHQPSGPGEDTSCLSSSCRRSSCTVLGGSVDLTHNMSSFPSLQHSHQSAATGLGMLEFREQQQHLSRAAARCSVTRGAAAIAGSCASIAAAAAATAAAAAARKAATAAAMADRNQADIDLRASTASGFSSLTSPGKSQDMSSLSAGLEQRHRWQQAQQHQQQQQHAQQQLWEQHQQLTSNPLWAPSPNDPTGSDSSSTRPNSIEPCLEAVATAALQAYDGISISSSEPACAEHSPKAAGALQHAADKLSKLPAVPPHLALPQQHLQEPPAPLQPRQQQHGQDCMQLQQHVRLPPQQQHQSLRYNPEELSALTSPQTGSSGSTTASAGPMAGAHQRPFHLAMSSNSRPPLYMQPTPSMTPARTAAQPSGVGPLHRNLASLSSSFGSNRSSTTPGFMPGLTY